MDPPGLPPRGGALFDVQANTSRGYCTSWRYSVEHAFRRDFKWQLTASREESPQQYNLPWGRAPTPQVPTMYVIQAVVTALEHDYGTPNQERFVLPQGVSYADIGNMMAERQSLVNWLDPYRHGLPSPFNIPDIFRRVAHRQQFLAGVRSGNIFDPHFTEFPQLEVTMMNELSGINF